MNKQDFVKATTAIAVGKHEREGQRRHKRTRPQMTANYVERIRRQDEAVDAINAYGPDHCEGCDCVLTSTDRERGACTSCGKSLPHR